MEAPPLSTPPLTTPTTPTPPVLYPDSVDSSPRSRNTDSLDADPPPPAKLRLLCSYGGHIVPRPHDKTLCYVGGDTRIIVIDRHTSLSDLRRRLSKNLFNNQFFHLKYQIPSEDLDSLITVTSDEDLENMVEEYDRLNNAAAGGRLRLFLFPETSSSIEQLLVETASTKSEDWFFNALNGKTSTRSASDREFSETSSINCLLGLDNECVRKEEVAAAVAVEKDVDAQIEASKGVANGNVNRSYGINHDVHSVPDSQTTSSFDSTSSSPSAANLPPIKTHVDDNRKVGALGIDEQFQQMSIGVVGNVAPPPPQKQDEAALIAASAAAVPVVSGFPVVVGSDYPNRVISDDERSDHRKPQQIQQVQFQPQQIPPQLQQKQANAFDLPSPDSVSSEGSLANAVSKQRQIIYQEPLIQLQSSKKVDPNTTDQNTNKIQMQPQIQESSYLITNQYDQNQPQFLHPSNHYIPTNAVPISSYYSVYPPHHQNHPHQSTLEQHYPVYFVSGKHFPVQQPNYGEFAPSNIAPHSGFTQTRSLPSSKPEMSSGVYRATAPQPQYVGFSQIHQPTSSPSPYEFSDPAHQQVFYTPLPPQLAAHYQTMTSAPDAENMKQQGRNLQQ